MKMHFLFSRNFISQRNLNTNAEDSVQSRLFPNYFMYNIGFQENIIEPYRTISQTNDSFVIDPEELLNVRNINGQNDSEESLNVRIITEQNNTNRRNLFRCTTDHFLNDINGDLIDVHNYSYDYNISIFGISSITRVIPGCILEKFFLVFLIVLIRCLHDFLLETFYFTILFFIFYYANNSLLIETIEEHNKSLVSLIITICCMTICLAFIIFELDTYVLLPNTQPLTFKELFVTVLATEFSLKFITVICKIILTCLPAELLEFYKRDKYYDMIEAISRLYRSIVPVLPWLYFLFKNYEEPYNAMGFLPLLVYITFKGNNIFWNFSIFLDAFKTKIGTRASTEDIDELGHMCTICHEDHKSPVLLDCDHIYCEDCILQWVYIDDSCPICRSPVLGDTMYVGVYTTLSIQPY